MGHQAERDKLIIDIYQEKSEAMRQFGGGVCHRANNILQVALGFADLLKYNKDELVEYSDRITNSLNDLKDIIYKIRIFSEKILDDVSVFDFRYFISDYIKSLSSNIPKNITIHSLLEENLYSLRGSKNHLRILIENLCKNAIESMEVTKEGKLDILLENIKISSTRLELYKDIQKGNFIKLTIKDSGQGMTPDVKKRIFDPYFTTKDFSSGRGLGLSVVHGIIKNHEGYIYVFSEKGKGSVIEVFLPAHQDEVKIEDNKIENINGNERILFVDDEEIIANLQRESLSMLGYNIIAVTKPLEALELFRKDPMAFDVLITDITMPLMSGDELAKKIHEIRSEIPIIFCSGHSASKLGTLPKNTTFLNKPTTFKETASEIRKVVDKDKTK